MIWFCLFAMSNVELPKEKQSQVSKIFRLGFSKVSQFVKYIVKTFVHYFIAACAFAVVFFIIGYYLNKNGAFDKIKGFGGMFNMFGSPTRT